MKSRAIFISTLLLLLGAATATEASPPADACATRRLVICLDGTQNSPEQDVGLLGGHKLYVPTNVLKTFRAIRPAGDDGVTQIAYYSEGVGSMIGEPTGYAKFEVFVDRIFGGAVGVGYEPRVKSAYRFLVANYQCGDQIFAFGFSRGAAEAQTLVRFIEWVGGAVHKKDAGGILNKRDEYWIPELYDGFRHSRTAEEVFKEIRQRSAATSPPPPAPPRGYIDDPQEARIEFLGVYETVLSVGSRLAPDGKVTTVAENYAYLVDKIPSKIVRTIRQALAIDERRWDFRPQIWQPDEVTPQRDHVKPLVQLWFPGVHSNIGGGYRLDDLSDRALAWMVNEAKTAGLSVDQPYLDHFVGENKCPANSNTLWTKIADLIRLKSGRGVRRLATWDQGGSWEKSGLGFHESLGQLLITDCTYRPQNLLKYLADHEKRIDEFPAQQRAAVQKIVDDFKAKVRSPCQASSCETKAARN